MTGHVTHQLTLLFHLSRYESAEGWAKLFPAVPQLGVEADRRFLEMFSAARLCGFEPGREDSFVDCLTWVRRRAETIRRELPNHVLAAQSRQAPTRWAGP